MSTESVILEGWNLLFRDLLYHMQSGSNLTAAQFKDRLTALINFTSISYQNNPDVIEYIPLLSQDVSGKYFSLIKRCADYLAGGATVNREKVVMIRTTRSVDGTTAYARLCKDGTNNGTLYDYVNYVGSGHHCKVIFDYNAATGATPGNISRIVRFKDLSIYFSAGIVAHDIILGNMIFDNCKMYFYRNIILHEVDVMDSTLLIHANATLSMEGGKLKSPLTNKNITVDANTQQLGAADFNLVEALPADPGIAMT